MAWVEVSTALIALFVSMAAPVAGEQFYFSDDTLRLEPPAKLQWRAFPEVPASTATGTSLTWTYTFQGAGEVRPSNGSFRMYTSSPAVLVATLVAPEGAPGDAVCSWIIDVQIHDQHWPYCHDHFALYGGNVTAGGQMRFVVRWETNAPFAVVKPGDVAYVTVTGAGVAEPGKLSFLAGGNDHPSRVAFEGTSEASTSIPPEVGPAQAPKEDDGPAGSTTPKHDGSDPLKHDDGSRQDAPGLGLLLAALGLALAARMRR